MEEPAPDPADDAPRIVDLRNLIITEIGDQGKRLTCWAFAWACAVEISHNRLYPFNMKSLSPQDLINNVPVLDNGSAPKLKTIGKWLMNTNQKTANGVVSSNDLWFYGYKRPNLPNRSKVNKTVITGYEVVETAVDEDKIVELLDQKTSVVAEIDCTPKFKKLKPDETYEYQSRKEEDLVKHAILIIGYQPNEHNQRCFIVRNSHGKNWAKGGYGLVAGGRNTFRSIGYVTKNK